MGISKDRKRSLPTSIMKHPHRVLQANSSRPDNAPRLTSVIALCCLRAGLQQIDEGEPTMLSLKTLAAAALLSAAAATPVFAQAPMDSQVAKNLRDSGYNPK